MTGAVTLEPFEIAVSRDAVDDLRRRVGHARWPTQPAAQPWAEGTDLEYLRELARHWGDGFDWRAHERALNELAHFQVAVGEERVHVVHVRGAGPDPIPVLLLHGWPATFTQMLRLAPLLSDPAAHGAADAPSFDVVIGSLPGFGFSRGPSVPGMGLAAMADLFHRVMTEGFGHRRYAVRGSDFGGGVLEQLAARHPDAVVGTHDAGPTPILGEIPADLSDDERRYVEAVRAWRAQETGYARQQRTRPQTLAYALNDSPTGLAAWIVEKLRRWSDCDGAIERRFSQDDVLVNVSIYWFTETIGSSIRLYLETDHDPPPARSTVPAAFLVSTKDMVAAPRSWHERSARVDRWTEVDRGGHFMEWEEPELVAHDMRAFFGELFHG